MTPQSDQSEAIGMEVTPKMLARTIAKMEESSAPELAAIPKISAKITLPQLKTLARIADEAEPTVITSPRHLASSSPRPMWLRPGERPEELELVIGILVSESHVVNRAGEEVDR